MGVLGWFRKGMGGKGSCAGEWGRCGDGRATEGGVGWEGPNGGYGARCALGNIYVSRRASGEYGGIQMGVGSLVGRVGVPMGRGVGQEFRGLWEFLVGD